MSKQREIQISQGICPKCGSDNLEYGPVEPEDESIYYPYTCQNCDFDGNEYYDVNFTGHKNCKTGKFLAPTSSG